MLPLCKEVVRGQVCLICVFWLSTSCVGNKCLHVVHSDGFRFDGGFGDIRRS